MKPVASILKNRQNYSTPSKKIVTFSNEDNSFQVHEPYFNRYAGQKISIHGTPSTLYLESNRKQQEMRAIISLLADSKVSNQQSCAQVKNDLCSIVHQQPQMSNTYDKNSPRKISKIQVSLRTNPRFSPESTNRRISFNTPQKKGNYSIILLGKSPISEKQKRKSRSISKTKRGISLVKNFTDKKTQHNPEPQTQDVSNKVITLKSQQISDHTIQNSYCRHFFSKIYNHFVQNNEVSKYNFSCILLHQKLIQDMVKDRRFVNKIWNSILIQTENKSRQTFPMKIVFAFLISVFGHSMEEISLFESQQALMKLNPEDNNQQAIKIFKHFRNKRQQFRTKILSRPKRQKSQCSQQN